MPLVASQLAPLEGRIFALVLQAVVALAIYGAVLWASGPLEEKFSGKAIRSTMAVAGAVMIGLTYISLTHDWLIMAITFAYLASGSVNQAMSSPPSGQLKDYFKPGAVKIMRRVTTKPDVNTAGLRRLAWALRLSDGIAAKDIYDTVTLRDKGDHFEYDYTSELTFDVPKRILIKIEVVFRLDARDAKDSLPTYSMSRIESVDLTENQWRIEFWPVITLKQWETAHERIEAGGNLHELDGVKHKSQPQKLDMKLERRQNDAGETLTFCDEVELSPGRRQLSYHLSNIPHSRDTLLFACFGIATGKWQLRAIPSDSFAPTDMQAFASGSLRCTMTQKASELVLDVASAESLILPDDAIWVRFNRLDDTSGSEVAGAGDTGPPR